MLLVMMKQMEMLTSYVKGFHAKNSHVVQDYDDGYYGNQGSNNVQFVDTNSQGSTEVLPPHMESTLEVVLEKVLVTEEGVQDLRSKLLDLTTMVKSHEVIIQQLQERMNELAFQMATPIAAINTAPRKDIMDDDVLEWEMEEEAIEELIVDVFLKGEELEEIHHVYKEIEDKVNQFQWVARIIAQGQPQWVVSKGLIHRRDLKFDARMCLDLVYSRLMPSRNTSEVPIEVAILLACIMKHVHINVGEIIVDQFRRKAKQQATALPFPSLVSMLCLRVECPLWRSLDKTIQVHGVINLYTKTNKKAPMIKRARYAGNMTPPSPVASPHIATAPANAGTSQTSPPQDLLNIAQREKIQENQLVRLAKAISSMIQSALKKALQPAKDKLTHLCSKVDVLESEVTTLQQEMATFTANTN
ncbi:hypothetical protein HAX54_005154 [Datura stramonium]|uniref:Putative plant transposon protein domain-containing protein n=1 Tax=Datura stramonium TaxID=4076 RepID=A0ABS8WWC9_DATST|nr:hypothetical protein [Datura stramonium]